MGWFSGSEDDGLAEGRIVLKMNPDLWMSLQNSDSPEATLAERALDELRFTYGYNDAEVQVIDDDPVFHQSAAEEYRKAQRAWHGKGKIVRTVKIRFGQPATRKESGRAIPPEN